MTSDMKFKIAFVILLCAVVFLFCRNVFGEIEKPITISIFPSSVLSSDYQRRTFQVRVTIPRHKDNRLWSYSASCGDEIKSSTHQLDATSPIVYEWYEELMVKENCIFQACLHRIVGGKIKNFCDYEEATRD